MQDINPPTPAQFLAPGQEPLMKAEILLGVDEITWTLRTTPADNDWRGVAYGNGLFVAVAVTGTGNRVMTSPDGITWTLRTSAADNDWRTVAYGNGLFVAVAFSGVGNRVMTSPDGITWTIRASAADNDWRDIIYAEGLFVAVANSGVGNRVMTSPDGINWTIRVSAADNSWVRIVHANGLFVAVANFGVGNRVMTSPDGITWTIRTSAADNDWIGIAYGNGLFVAVAETGVGNRVMTSPNGIDWTIRVSAADNDWRAVTFANGLFVAVANSGVGNRVMTSRNGIDWTLRTSAADNDWWSVAYGNGLFVAVAVTGVGNRVMTSPDWINLCDLDNKCYVESISVSLGGASMTPNPVAGKWGATLFNENSIFHPQHPTSAYKDWLVTERLTRISVGAIYGGVDYYWQRVIGYMNEPKFSSPDYKVTISGGDYMKRLRETEFRHLNNYWGSTWTTNSISSDGASGAELYNEADAMDITGEVNNVANWVPAECTFVSLADITGGSAFVGKMITTSAEPLLPTVVNNNIFVPVIGTEYRLDFKYIRKAGSGASLRVRIVQFDVTWRDIAQIEELYQDAWTEEKLYFTAVSVNPIQIWLEIYESPIGSEFWVDQFSIFQFVPYWERYYDLRGHDANEKGVHHVTLDPTTGPEDVWQGEGDEGWYYAEDAQAGPDPPAHPAGIVFFDPNKTVAVGVNNLVIYYYTTTAIEDVLAWILWSAGVGDTDGIPYVNEAAAKAAIVAAPDYVDPAIDVDKVWFEPGTTYLDAIRIICERCDYRFYFDYDGTPVFRPKPTAGAAVFTFTSPSQIASISGPYQSASEIKNRIIIKGMKQAEPVNRDETVPTELKGEDSDATSITAYGERTLTITNHLFQTQAAIDAMCTSLLAEYKDPKWYSNLRVPFNPVPLQLGDNIQWEERLSPILDITQTGIIRDIKIDNFHSTYKCEHT